MNLKNMFGRVLTCKWSDLAANAWAIELLDLREEMWLTLDDMTGESTVYSKPEDMWEGDNAICNPTPWVECTLDDIPAQELEWGIVDAISKTITRRG